MYSHRLNRAVMGEKSDAFSFIVHNEMPTETRLSFAMRGATRRSQF